MKKLTLRARWSRRASSLKAQNREAALLHSSAGTWKGGSLHRQTSWGSLEASDGQTGTSSKGSRPDTVIPCSSCMSFHQHKLAYAQARCHTTPHGDGPERGSFWCWGSSALGERNRRCFFFFFPLLTIKADVWNVKLLSRCIARISSTSRATLKEGERGESWAF